MADQEKTYLINFEDNLAEYEQRARDAKKTVDQLTGANDELKKSGTATAEQIEKSNGQLKQAQINYRDATKQVDIATKAHNAELNSYDRLYQQWKLAQTQLKLMGNAYEINSDGVRVLSQKYVDQSKVVADAKKSLDNFGKGVHDNRLMVGSYSEAIEGATGKFGMMPGPIGQAGNAVGGLSKAFKMLLANPIVALIAAIVLVLMGLIKAFKSTDSGGTKLASIMEQVSAVLDVVRLRAIALFGALTSLFKGDFKKAGQQFKDTFTGIKEQINAATNAAKEYTYAIDGIEDVQNNFVSRSAEIKLEMAKLEYTAADRTKATAERRKALMDSIALATEELTVNKELTHSKLMAEAAYLASKNGLRADDVIGFIKMTDAEQANASESLKNLRDNNEGKINEIEKLYADWLATETTFFEEQKRNNAKQSAFLIELQKEAAEKAAAAEIEAKRKAAEQSVAIMNKELADHVIAADKRLNVRVTSEKSGDDATKVLRDRRAEALQIEYESAQALLENTIFGELDLEQQRLDKERAMEIANAESVGASTFDIMERYARAENAIENAKRDAKLELAQGAANSLADIFGETTAAGKAAAVASTMIDTFRSAQSAFSGMVQAIPGPVGIAGGIVAAAGAVAIGLSNVKKILAVKTPKGKGGGGSIPGGGASAMGSAAQKVTAKPLGPTTLQPIQSAQDVQKQQSQQSLTADSIADAVSKLPAPVVTIEDINAKTNQAKKIEVRANM